MICSGMFGSGVGLNSSVIDMNFVFYVRRGGGWDSDGRHAASGNRNGYEPGYRSSNIGFRIIRRKV